MKSENIDIFNFYLQSWYMLIEWTGYPVPGLHKIKWNHDSKLMLTFIPLVSKLVSIAYPFHFKPQIRLHAESQS